MMTKDDYRHYVCIVAGENPSKLMSDYDINKKVEPYIVYKFSDAEKLRETYIDSYQKMLDETKDEDEIEYIKDTILDLSEMDSTEFFYDISSNYIIDNKTGNAMSDVNKNGKWSSCQIGKILSVPFLTIDGREVFQARKKDIDWGKIHGSNGDVYRRAWEMVMDNSEPKDDYEKQIYENMKDKTSYFKKFETKDNYIISNTAFWGYAFLSEETGWQDASDVEDQFMWMANFYNVFIDMLPDDTLLTIYECMK